MGAIFDEVKKKKNLIKWNKYYVNYVWNRYNVNYSYKNVTDRLYSNDEEIQISAITNYATLMKGGYQQHTIALYQNKYCFNFVDLLTGYYAYLKDCGGTGLTIYDMFFPDAKSKSGQADTFYFMNVGKFSVIDNNTVSIPLSTICNKITLETIKSKGSTYYGTVVSISRNKYPDDNLISSTYSTEYWYTYTGTQKGSLIKTVYGKEGQYPDDGIQDGYWYELII